MLFKPTIKKKTKTSRFSPKIKQQVHKKPFQIISFRKNICSGKTVLKSYWTSCNKKRNTICAMQKNQLQKLIRIKRDDCCFKHTHTHTRTHHIHTLIHSDTHTHTKAHAPGEHENKHIHTHSHTHTYTPTHTETYWHTHTLTHTDTHTHTHMHPHTCTPTQVHTPTHTHTFQKLSSFEQIQKHCLQNTTQNKERFELSGNHCTSQKCCRTIQPSNHIYIVDSLSTKRYLQRKLKLNVTYIF